jgi:hypothetical protein
VAVRLQGQVLSAIKAIPSLAVCLRRALAILTISPTETPPGDTGPVTSESSRAARLMAAWLVGCAVVAEIPLLAAPDVRYPLSFESGVFDLTVSG